MHHHRYYQNYAGDDSFPNMPGISCTGFWLVNILGGILIFYLGMRFALKRTPLLPIVLYRLLCGTAYR